MGGALLRARRHALGWGATAAMVVSGLVVLPSSPAVAVSTGRPVAVAVAKDGTSYVGFASGHRLLRLAPDGTVDGSVPLDLDGPLTGLDVAADGHLWVDDGASVSELSPDGELLTHFPHEPVAGCPADRAHDPATYGGIEVAGGLVLVAGRCAATVGVYSAGGDHRATIDPPGSGLPGGVALAPAFKDLPSRLYVSVPSAGKVFMYDAGSLRRDPEPVRTLTVQKSYGYADPRPTDVIADEKGQIGVLDQANNALYFYNGTDRYWFYRALGHPPDAASDRGFLDRPSSVDHAGGSFKLGLWVADTGNGRVQRWDHIGTTSWMTDTMPPGDPGAPVNETLPEISGRPFVDQQLTCDTGAWDGAASFEVSWLRDGLPLAADTTTYVVRPADVGSELVCVVVAVGGDGASSAPASSEAFPVPGAGSPPYVVERPVVQGQARSGSIVRCSRGTWTDTDPTTYQWGWLRDGQLLPGTNAPEYYVTDNDVYHQLTCRVAAGNRNGVGKAALSDPVLVEEGRGGGGGGRPENLTRPRIVGDAKAGAVLTCDPGTWENAPVFGYVWRRDGQPIGGSEQDRYEVLGADLSQELTCLVTGTNPAGSDSVSSPPVRPRGQVDGGGGGGSGSGKTCRGTPSVQINGGDRYATTPYVTLRIKAPADATAVTISNDASFRRADTQQLRSSCTYRWTLEKRSSKVPRTVRVRFVGAASAGTVSDRIVVDSFAPRLRKVTAHWNRARWAWVLGFRVTERGTGLASVQVGKTRRGARTVRWGRPVASADSSQLRWVRVRDKAGNASGWYRLRL